MVGPTDQFLNEARDNALRQIASLLLHQPVTIGYVQLAQMVKQQPSLVRIRASQAIWQEQPEISLGTQLLGTLRGLDNGQNATTSFIISWYAQRSEFQLCLGNSSPHCADRLAQLHPQLSLTAPDYPALTQTLDQRGLRYIVGDVTNAGTAERYAPQLESLLDLRPNWDWSLCIWFSPVATAEVLTMFNQFLEWQDYYSGFAERSTTLGQTTQRTTRGTLQRAVELIDQQLKRLREGLSSGIWSCSTCVSAPAEHVDTVVARIFAGYSGAGTVRALQAIAPNLGEYTTNLAQVASLQTTAELAALVTLPRVELRGYQVLPFARFDVDTPHAQSGVLQLGQVVDDGRRLTGQVYGLPLDYLARHALVVGMTGSGKSNTCKGLVRRVHTANVPVLIVEPAKAEYRSLGQRTFTLGNEREAPLRLNPFELPLIKTGTGMVFAPVQSHIDHLKTVFNASFVLFAPMPYILERCLHDIYEQRGWDLSSGMNRRENDLDRLFPTLSDLYDRIAEVVPQLGYDLRLEMDIRAGLLARIESLRTGGRGLLLDCRRSSPTIDDLLNTTTVLELEAIGNDDEKSFVMGLILILTYEYRLLQASVERASTGIANANPRLRHLVLIEEAHRLLAERSSAGTGDRADVSGHTIESFAQMLAEMRAFGQGFLIVDQVPARLAPTVVKNTELKIAHKLVAADDRELIAGTTGLNDAQSRYLAALPQGFAVVHSGLDDRPVLLRMNHEPAAAAAIQHRPGLLPPPLRSCPDSCPAWKAQQRCPLPLRTVGRAIAAQLERKHLPALIASWSEGVSYREHTVLMAQIQTAAQRSSAVAAEQRVIAACASLHLAEQGLTAFERLYPQWPFDLSTKVTRTVVDQQHAAQVAGGQLFREQLRNALLTYGPFPVCQERCTTPCRFRLYSRAVTEPYRTRLRRGPESARQIAEIVVKHAANILQTGIGSEARRSLNLCLVAHLASHISVGHEIELIDAAISHIPS